MFSMIYTPSALASVKLGVYTIYLAYIGISQYTLGYPRIYLAYIGIYQDILEYMYLPGIYWYILGISQYILVYTKVCIGIYQYSFSCYVIWQGFFSCFVICRAFSGFIRHLSTFSLQITAYPCAIPGYWSLSLLFLGISGCQLSKAFGIYSIFMVFLWSYANIYHRENI